MATYAANFPEAQSITGDIRSPSVKERILAAARQATVLIGGPPCQAFSQVRNHTRMIDDPRNALYREFVDVLKQTLPPSFVVENVTGMDQMGVREQIAADLSLEGEYTVLPQVVDAADFGVPQAITTASHVLCRFVNLQDFNPSPIASFSPLTLGEE